MSDITPSVEPTAPVKTVDFVHLHCHSHYSLLDGLAEVDDLVSTSKELNYGAMALTDHGTCAGLYKFQKSCKKHGLKPILGCELYTTKDHQYKEKDAKMFHLLALAKNKTGLRNLFSLSSIAETKGKYRKPRVDFDLLTKYHEGLICTSGCPSAEIPMALHANDDALAEILVRKYKDLLGDDFYIEIMFHKYFKDNVQQQREKDNARKLLALAKKFDVKAIATNDVHYCKKDHWKYHDVLLSMQTGDTIKNPDRFTYDSNEFYIKSFEEMMAYYSSNPQLLTNTLEIAEKVEANLLSFSKDLLPTYVLPQGYDSEEAYLKDLVRDGMRDKGLLDNQIYRDRIKFEMSAIIKCGYTRYFLILWDMINFAKHNNVKIGVGRGSAAGSLCLYVLGIVGLDPIKYNLLFERFINPERVSPPDVDIDFDYFRRDEIFDYVTRKYGLDFTCKIGTYNSFKARAVIRYAVKALDLGNDWELTKKLRESNPKADETKNSLNLADMISKEIDEGPNVTIDDSMKKNERFRNMVSKYPGLIDIARHLEGRLSSAGVHAAGVVVCKEPILMHLPMRESNGVICSQFDKEEVEELGLLKFDCLALKTVTVMDNTVKMIEKRSGVKIDLDNLEPNDHKVLDLFNGRYPNMDNRGIFQFESYGMMKLLKNIHVDSFDDLIVCNALYRPGPLGAGVHDLYADNKHKRNPAQSLHPMMDEVLKDTYGIIVYQECLMKIAQRMAGFTRGESDVLRKCVTGGTMFVSKSRGWISIKDLLTDGYQDDLFLTMDKRGCQKWVKISKIWHNGKKRVNHVTTKSGFHVDLTGLHQILTDSGWKARKRIAKDDFIICANDINYDGEDRISCEMSIVIAGLLTEGYFVENASTFTNYDKGMMSIFTESFYKVFGVYPRLGVDGKVAYVNKKERELIHKYLWYAKSQYKEIPAIMMGMTKESTRKFLSYMLSAEGGVTKKDAHFEFSSKSYKMISQVKLLLLRFGVSSLLLNRTVNGQIYWRLYINDVNDQRALISSGLTEYWEKYKIDDITRHINRSNQLTTNIVPQSVIKKMMNQYPQAGNCNGLCSGTVYNANLSRQRFLQIAKFTCDKKWIELVDGKQRYDKINDTTTVLSKSMDVYDFTVDDEKTPSLIANGIVIHNCIGKKKLDLLAQQRDKFVNGCIKNNNVDKDVANKIFDQIEYFGGYGFNKCLSGDTLVKNKVDGKYYRLDELESDFSNYAIEERFRKNEFSFNGYPLLEKPNIVLDSLKNGKIVEDKVLDVFETGEQELYEVELDNGMIIKCTMEHKFYCADGKAHTLKDIMDNELEIEYKITTMDKGFGSLL